MVWKIDRALVLMRVSLDVSSSSTSGLLLLTLFSRQPLAFSSFPLFLSTVSPSPSPTPGGKEASRAMLFLLLFCLPLPPDEKRPFLPFLGAKPPNISNSSMEPDSRYVEDCRGGLIGTAELRRLDVCVDVNDKDVKALEKQGSNSKSTTEKVTLARPRPRGIFSIPLRRTAL
jgi:hypothetical protein